MQGKERVDKSPIMFWILVIGARLRDKMNNVDTGKHLDTEITRKVKETR
jgi:hypothetical protein